MKDLFSDNSYIYQQARPSYPHSVIAVILKYVPSRQFVWDCGAGSGQFTQLLAPYFEHVVATDLSEQQLQQAPYFENVSYQVQHAEQTSFADHSFDLITVAQAIHWFDFDRFYAEVKRTLKGNGVVAVIGYGLIQIKDPQINQLIRELYYNTLKGYWDIERHYVDEGYQTIPFPFDEISVPDLDMQYQWTLEQLLNYLSTWSAIKTYKQKNQIDPLEDLQNYFKHTHASDLILEIEFPIFLRIGRLEAVKKNHKCKTPKFMKYAFKS